MKATRKRREAIQALARMNPQPIKMSQAAMWESEQLYSALEGLGMRWDSATGWIEARAIYERRLSAKSEFSYDDGSASPVCKIRIMAHPHLLPILASIISNAPGLAVLNISHDHPNRAGAGARQYIEAIVNADHMPQADPAPSTSKRTRKAKTE